MKLLLQCNPTRLIAPLEKEDLLIWDFEDTCVPADKVLDWMSYKQAKKVCYIVQPIYEDQTDLLYRILEYCNMFDIKVLVISKSRGCEIEKGRHK